MRRLKYMVTSCHVNQIIVRYITYVIWIWFFVLNYFILFFEYFLWIYTAQYNILFKIDSEVIVVASWPAWDLQTERLE